MAEIARLFPDVQQPRDGAHARRLAEAMRIAEALLFAATEPMPEAAIAARLPDGVATPEVLAALKEDYAHRGVRLVRVGAKWLFRTADDLGWLLSASGREMRKLSRAALETLAIIAYHQPATRAEIEDIRGVAVAKGTLDVLMEDGLGQAAWAPGAPPGRPITYGTTEGFLLHFGLETIGDLPGLDELRGAGLFDGRLPPSFAVPAAARRRPRGRRGAAGRGPGARARRRSLRGGGRRSARARRGTIRIRSTETRSPDGDARLSPCAPGGCVCQNSGRQSPCVRLARRLSQDKVE